MRISIRPLILSILVVLAASAASSQIITVDVLLKTFEIPPIAFSGLVQPRREVIATENRQGCWVQVVNWTARGGRFRYPLEGGRSLSGRIRRFSLKGKMLRPDSPCGQLLEINPGQLKIELLLDTPFNIPAYGGNVSVASGQAVLLTNSSAINISRYKPVHSEDPLRVTKLGTLELSTASRVRWSNAKFVFPELPQALGLDLVSTIGTITRFSVPLEKPSPQITDAKFSYIPSRSNLGRGTQLNTEKYRALLEGIRLGSLSASLTSDALSLDVRNLSVQGRLTGKSGTGGSLPVLFSGVATVDRLTSGAEFSEAEASMKGTRFTGLKLVPTSSNVQSPIGSVRWGNRDISQISLDQPVRRGPSGMPSTTEHATLSEVPPGDCYKSSAEQRIDIEKLSMSSLEDRQSKAIQISREALANIDKADFVVNLPRRYLEPLIREFAASKLQLQLSDVTFGNQTLLVCSNIGGIIPGPQLPNFRMAIKVSPTLETVQVKEKEVMTDRLGVILRYEAAMVNLDGYEEAEETTPEELVNEIGSGILAEEKRAASAKYSLPLPLGIIKLIDLNKTYTQPGSSDVFELKAKKMSATVTHVPNQILIFVEPDGMHVMGKVIYTPTEKEN